MITIYKYPLGVTDDQTIEMPKYSDILSIHMQHGAPCMWVRVVTDNPLVKRHFKTYGTGHPVDSDKGIFRGTFLTDNDNLVFHVFEIGW